MQTWRFLVVRDPAIKAAVAHWYRRGWHETVGPRYRAGAPPPGSSRERFDRLMKAAERLDKTWQTLERGQLRLALLAQRFATPERRTGHPRVLDVALGPFVRVQVRRVAGQNMQRHFAVGRRNVVAHSRRLVRGQSVHHQVQRFAAIAHHPLQQFDKQLRGQCPFIKAVPKPALGMHRRGGRDRLPLTEPLHDRPLPLHPPGRPCTASAPKPDSSQKHTSAPSTAACRAMPGQVSRCQRSIASGLR